MNGFSCLWGVEMCWWCTNKECAWPCILSLVESVMSASPHHYLVEHCLWTYSECGEALCEHKMFCSPKKTDLFCMSVQFLVHIISAKTNDVELDPMKINTIANWPIPRNATVVHSFLKFVCYMATFLQKLADHTTILTPLTTKAVDCEFLAWNGEHQHAFDAFKGLVLSKKCLTVIDHKNPGENQIFVTCNASDLGTSAILSFSVSWECKAHCNWFNSTERSRAGLPHSQEGTLVDSQSPFLPANRSVRLTFQSAYQPLYIGKLLNATELVMQASLLARIPGTIWRWNCVHPWEREYSGLWHCCNLCDQVNYPSRHLCFWCHSIPNCCLK